MTYLDTTDPSSGHLGRRRFLTAVAAIPACHFLGVECSQGQDNPKLEQLTSADLVTPDAERSIAQGLKFLAEQQNEDGSFGGGSYGRNVGICGLAGLAFIGSGSTPGRGQRRFIPAQAAGYRLPEIRMVGALEQQHLLFEVDHYQHRLRTFVRTARFSSRHRSCSPACAAGCAVPAAAADRRRWVPRSSGMMPSASSGRQ